MLTRLSSSVVIVSFPSLASSPCKIKSICLYANQLDLYISSADDLLFFSTLLGEYTILNFLFCLGSISNPVSISPLAPEEHFFFLPDFYSFCLPIARVLYISYILQ